MLSLYEFETVEAPVVDVPAGGDLSSDAAAPSDESGAPVESAPPSDATDNAPAWDDDAFREAVERETHALVQAEIARLVPQNVEQPVAAELPELDPFDPAFAGNLAALIKQSLESTVAPLLSTAQQQQQAAVEQRWNEVVQDVIADETTRNGDLTQQEIDALNLIGVSIMPEMQAKYGQTPRAVEATVAKSAGIIRAMKAEAAQAAVEAYKNELGTLGGARNELGATGTGGGMQGLTQAQTAREVVARWAPVLQGTQSS